MTIYLAPFICTLGAVLYCFSRHPKVIELGRIMFFAGLLAVLLVYGGRVRF
jgi:Na+/phosphate symporter